MATSTDFFENTVAVFADAEEPEGKPDYVSESGSMYFYTADGVFRVSDHWGHGIASCHWFLGDSWKVFETVTMDSPVCGFCSWDAFMTDGNGSIICKMADFEEATKRNSWPTENRKRVEALEKKGAVCC